MQWRGDTVHLKANITHKVEGPIRSIGIVSPSTEVKLSVNGGEAATISETFFTELYEDDRANHLSIVSAIEQTIGLILNARSVLQFNDLAKAIGGTEFTLDTPTLDAQQDRVKAAVKDADAVASVVTYPTKAVGTGATVIINALATRKEMLVYNQGPNTAYIGGAGVTDLKGIPLPADQSIVIPGRGTVYAICSGGESATLRLLESREVA